MDLSRVLSPRTIAIIGASRKEGSVGEAIFKNILQAGFRDGGIPLLMMVMWVFFRLGDMAWIAGQ
jgi:hypothetical protein